ncbi:MULTISPECIES: hypothetical protein [Xanthobacter]|uniref:virion core protein, T7 gp14 family n=1 Tax=Xanthobacter TaxID=279 RepID=UPI001F2BF727|nr:MULTISPECIES: hypothetical protein [Xanthobacter]MCL8384159.1 hypothetical protein [Xanthobacter aminoxidans]
MCVAALPLLSLGLSIAGGVASYQAAKSQADAQNQMYRENARDANKAADNQYAALQHKSIQERNAADQKLFENNIDALRARSQARTSAGEAGVTGLSVNALVNDLWAQQGRRDDATMQNYQTARDDAYAQMDQVKANTQSRINSVQRAKSPSFLPFLIGGISGGLGAFG